MDVGNELNWMLEHGLRNGFGAKDSKVTRCLHGNVFFMENSWTKTATTAVAAKDSPAETITYGS